MEELANTKKPKKPGGEAPEIRVVGIDVKPAPDAQARLRRLFSILVKLAEDDLPAPGTDPRPDSDDEENS